MNTAFYAAAIGAGTQQAKLDNIANNLANVNTVGYKAQTTSFSDLIKYNMSRGTVQENITAGTGIRLENTGTSFNQGGYLPVDSNLMYAIEGDGFFALQNPVTNEITYTRDGNFQISRTGEEEYYLISSTGKRVLDPEGNQIPVKIKQVSNAEGEENYEEGELDDNGNPIPKDNWVAAADQNFNIGIYTFTRKDGMLRAGENEFSPIAKNGAAVVSTTAQLKRKMLENSNVDVATEMTRMIESQRAYSYALKMVQTSDEVEGIFNSLRG